MTVDGHHLVGAAPGIDGLFVIGGCNVGGLSVLPALGELLAQLVAKGSTEIDIDFMSPSRFSANYSAKQFFDLCVARYANYYI